MSDLMTYREMLKTAGITEEQVAKALGYKSAHNMRTSNRCERARQSALNLYNLITAQNAPEAHDVAPEQTIPRNPATFLTFYREAATDKIAAVTDTPGTAHPGTDDPNFAVWAFYLYNDQPKAVNMPRHFLGTKWVECENPCDYPSGPKLWEHLQPWHSWHLFMEQVDIKNKYDGILKFHLEYPTEVVNALAEPGGMLPVPFASTGRVFASPILTDYMKQHTRLIDEKTARIVCPSLFVYLDSLPLEEISSKKQDQQP